MGGVVIFLLFSADSSNEGDDYRDDCPQDCTDKKGQANDKSNEKYRVSRLSRSAAKIRCVKKAEAGTGTQ
ncbi:MAG TPA: hypothetical protein VNY81_01970 [Candidatus Saccharimonadales bacterium]|nr:hypothetical protein [Candidatus Saccharimonadales bacterium]